ncbi:MAG: quinate 5-dehydrogenase [Coriobacteriia bacterium]|nr:quinate 5-dehydrogenase [Coriobacteriia bacterium]
MEVGTVESTMPQVVSISLGSSARDHKTQIDLGGQRLELWRQGCDNDKERLIERLCELDADPNVVAVGLGGLDFFLESAGKRYWFREVKPLKQYVTHKPFVGGGGLKGAFEKNAVTYLADHVEEDLKDKKVLCISGLDRWGLACGFEELGASVRYGDLLWALGIPHVIGSQEAFIRLVHLLAPLAVQLPFAMLYDSNADHHTEPQTNAMAEREYHNADIFIGDYKMIIKYLPRDMEGKWVITNTTTAQDVEFLRSRGVELLVTTTPRLEGRSFGTNLIEASLIALDGASEALEPQRYVELAHELGIEPSMVYL